MFEFIIVLIVIAIIVLFMLPTWNHMSKLDYMKKQGYSQVYKHVGYNGYMELTFIKGHVKVTEGMLRTLSLREIKRRY